ncbi:MAG: CRISPR-associated endonuclease Cas1 [Candidatus Sumerlaeaceae bacterium]|nr:CRISPR-associated endonuclease Cas1 [Candidatus Sumerlaeaceae bacterium]
MTGEPNSRDRALAGGPASPPIPLKPAPSESASPIPAPLPLLPVRALGDFAYCPRLAWLWWRDGGAGWTSRRPRHHDTRTSGTAGASARPGDARHPGAAPDADHTDGDAPLSAEFLSSPDLGLEAVVWTDTTGAPVLQRTGAGPDGGGAWRGDEDMVAAHGLLLDAAGRSARTGIIVYAAADRRAEVTLDAQRTTRTREQLAALRRVLAQSQPPPPAENERLCVRCRAAPLCLPDETRMLTTGARPAAPLAASGSPGSAAQAPTARPAPVRRLMPARTDAYPLVVQRQGAQVGWRGRGLAVREGSTVLQEVRLDRVSEVCVFGSCQVTTPALHALMTHNIPVLYFTTGGWFYGVTEGLDTSGVRLRVAQYRLATEAALMAGRVRLARRFVAGKIRNMAWRLRRGGATDAARAVGALADAALRVGDDANAGSSATPDACGGALGRLMGLEGQATRLYFARFGAMIRPAKTKTADPAGVAGANGSNAAGRSCAAAHAGCAVPVGEGGRMGFVFEHRNRRPPQDPVNALLSYAYGLLAKDMTVAVRAVGFDPMVGFLHEIRAGRPALALDLMEAFRPLVADGAVLEAVNTRAVGPEDFVTGTTGCALTPDGRRRFIEVYERRLDRLVTHPVFGYRLSYRRVFEVQARLLARAVTGELDDYAEFEVRR